MRNKVKQFGLGIGAVCLSMYGFSGISTGFAETTVVTAAQTSTSEATADTLPACSWYVSGVDDAIALTHPLDMEYVGDDYELRGENEGDISVYFSGGETPDTRCSFYDDEKGVDVQVTWSGTAFTNSDPTDTSLNFQAGDELENVLSNDGDPSTFNVTYDGETCNGDWVAGDAKKIGIDISPIVPASIGDVAVATNYGPTTKPAGTFASCNLTATYSTWLPGNKTPSNPGSPYTFTGPTLTTTVVIP